MSSPSGQDGAPHVVALTLFIAGNSSASQLARAHLESAFDRLTDLALTLETVDVFADPMRALRERVLVTPTLLAYTPPRRVIGDLSDPDLLDFFLRSLFSSI